MDSGRGMIHERTGRSGAGPETRCSMRQFCSPVFPVPQRLITRIMRRWSHNKFPHWKTNTKKTHHSQTWTDANRNKNRTIRLRPEAGRAVKERVTGDPAPSIGISIIVSLISSSFKKQPFIIRFTHSSR